jgi:hypothetical protein
MDHFAYMLQELNKVNVRSTFPKEVKMYSDKDFDQHLL